MQIWTSFVKAISRHPRLVATMLLLIPAFVHFFPILYMLSVSSKFGPEVFRYPPEIIPDQLRLQNYRAAFQAAPLGRYLFNSLFVAASITLLQVLTAILAAYALARLEFPGRKLAFVIIIATMLVPAEVTIVPNYLTVARLGWIDTYYGLIAPFAASGFGIFLLYQFFRTIPRELEEAATIDGASRMRFLFQIMVPLSLPAVIGFAVFAFVSAWNQYLWPLIITQSSDMQTVQIAIGMFRSQQETDSWGVIMAATTVLVTPSILLFMVAQKHFVRGVTMSGIKG